MRKDPSNQESLRRGEEADRESEVLNLRGKVGAQVRGGRSDLGGGNFDDLREIVLTVWRRESGITAHDSVCAEGPSGDDPRIVEWCARDVMDHGEFIVVRPTVQGNGGKVRIPGDGGDVLE